MEIHGKRRHIEQFPVSKVSKLKIKIFIIWVKINLYTISKNYIFKLSFNIYT